jgi:hypothetical protein
MLELKIRPVMRLSEVERLIKRHRIIIPPLTRETLRKMCEEGIFETAARNNSNLGWLVFEDSFQRWVEELNASAK